MEAKFTKGIWKELNGDGCQQELIITTNDRWNNSQGVICEMDVIFDGHHGVEQKANAHLIASAPDMYELLLSVNNSINQCRNEIELADKVASLSHNIDQALKKARGEINE